MSVLEKVSFLVIEKKRGQFLLLKRGQFLLLSACISSRTPQQVMGVGTAAQVQPLGQPLYVRTVSARRRSASFTFEASPLGRARKVASVHPRRLSSAAMMPSAFCASDSARSGP